MRAAVCVTLLWFVTALPAAWADSRQSSTPPQKNLEEIVANDNRSSAGQLRN